MTRFCHGKSAAQTDVMNKHMLYNMFNRMTIYNHYNSLLFNWSICSSEDQLQFCMPGMWLWYS